MSEEILDILKRFNQDQILNFYEDLSDEEKKELVEDIKKINFPLMEKLYKNSFFDEAINIKKIKPLQVISNKTLEEKEKYCELGKELIINNNYAICLLAGGLGSRLGHNAPKGTLEINYQNKKVSLFELYLEQLKKIKDDFGIYINLYIMTSNVNDQATKEFFELNDYFNYPKKNIIFFKQEYLPILDIDGKILLRDKAKVLFGPNGNGNVFKALKNNKILEDMEKKNIKYVLFSTIDNVLSNLIDFCFIGATLFNHYKIASKTILKSSEKEKDWVFCKYYDYPFMLPLSYITEEITNEKDINNNYIYRDKNIVCHLISLDSIKKFADIDLKYHRAYKKNAHIDLNGKLIKPESPNSFKFEQFIYDAFYYENDMLLYRTSEKEFCPIKVKDDIIKAERALEEKGV